ncbi:thermonuclease family protein [Patescibacteria group bacterium]|nr:thermonuclease family protein [Patescibacteria group bacterium]
MGTKKKIAIVTALLSALGLGGYTVVKTSNYGGVEENLHMVVEVIDGDTFKVEGDDESPLEKTVVSDDLSQTGQVSVRILNIAAPDKGECYFEESRDALKELIEGKEVKLRKDVSGVDKFGRLLRHVFLPSGMEDEDDLLVAQYMVENGFAKAIPVVPDFEYKRYLAQMENKAIAGELGVWGNCEELPKYFGDVTDIQVEDSECVIKGNISTENPTKFYFLPNCAPYSQIKIDAERGERYFCSEEEAEEAGFTKSATCNSKY